MFDTMHGFGDCWNVVVGSAAAGALLVYALSRLCEAVKMRIGSYSGKTRTAVCNRIATDFEEAAAELGEHPYAQMMLFLCAKRVRGEVDSVRFLDEYTRQLREINRRVLGRVHRQTESIPVSASNIGGG